MTDQDTQELFDKLPVWAKSLVRVAAIAALIKINQLEMAEKQKKVLQYTQRAEEEVSQLISMEYSEAVSIIKDDIPRMDAEYWDFFKARLSYVATNYKTRNLYARALEIREGNANFLPQRDI